jgi:hypothetical protein
MQMSLSCFIRGIAFTSTFCQFWLKLQEMELLQLEFFINMEYYILLATFSLSLVSYTLGLDLSWWLIIFECTSNVNIAICLCAPNAIYWRLTLHYIIGVLKISLSEIHNRAFAIPTCCDDGIRSFCVHRIRWGAIWRWPLKSGLHISDSRIS